jgi:hypothetical protein
VYQDYADNAAINQKGLVAMTVTVVGWANKTAQYSYREVALNGDVQNGLVAAPGQVIGNCTVAQAYAGTRSINKNGQIAIYAQCAYAGPNTPVNAIIVATPVLTKK